MRAGRAARLLASWATHPEAAPNSGPDLAVLRAELDKLTTQLLAELVRVDRLVSRAVFWAVFLGYQIDDN
jgi:hypothetical protein